jgi:hypothetical protein
MGVCKCRRIYTVTIYGLVNVMAVIGMV